MSRALWWPLGGGKFLMSEVPLYGSYGKIVTVELKGNNMKDLHWKVAKVMTRLRPCLSCSKPLDSGLSSYTW